MKLKKDLNLIIFLSGLSFSSVALATQQIQENELPYLDNESISQIAAFTNDNTLSNLVQIHKEFYQLYYPKLLNRFVSKFSREVREQIIIEELTNISAVEEDILDKMQQPRKVPIYFNLMNAQFLEIFSKFAQSEISKINKSSFSKEERFIVFKGLYNKLEYIIFSYYSMIEKTLKNIFNIYSTGWQKDIYPELASIDIMKSMFRNRTSKPLKEFDEIQKKIEADVNKYIINFLDSSRYTDLTANISERSFELVYRQYVAANLAIDYSFSQTLNEWIKVDGLFTIIEKDEDQIFQVYVEDITKDRIKKEIRLFDTVLELKVETMEDIQDEYEDKLFNSLLFLEVFKKNIIPNILVNLSEQE